MTGPLRVLHVSTSGILGGAERVLVDLMSWQRRNRPEWDVRLITLGVGPLTKAGDSLGVHTACIPLPHALARLGESGSGRSRLVFDAARALGSGWPYMRRLRTAICGGVPQVIHSHGLKAHTLLSLMRIPAASLVWHMHDYVSARPVSARVLGALADSCETAIAISPSVADDLREILPQLRVATVLNGIDVERFQRPGVVAPLDALSGLPEAPPATLRVGLVATFARWKGHQTFLRALVELSNEPLRGYVIGAPVYHTQGSQYSLAELQSLVSALGLQGRVGFTGFIDDHASAMRALDIVVHASTSPEPFGLAIAEAMAAGRAVVVSPLGGAKELIREEHDALVHRPGDSGSLAAAIRQLATSHALRSRLGSTAQESARERFSRDRTGYETAEVYARLQAWRRAA